MFSVPAWVHRTLQLLLCVVTSVAFSSANCNSHKYLMDIATLVMSFVEERSG